jgi:hypothetical protein
MLLQFYPPIPRQIYNEELDACLFKMLGIEPGDLTTTEKFLELLLSRMPNIIPLATHLGEDEEYTESRLQKAQKFIKNKIISSNGVCL